MSTEREVWLYERTRRVDRRGVRWHFVSRLLAGGAREFDMQPYELYFRDDDRTQFGLLRFEHRKDNPYRHDVVVAKIMNDEAFRRPLLDAKTAGVWSRSWK